VLHIANSLGRKVWACADGSVIREGIRQESSTLVGEASSLDQNTLLPQLKWITGIQTGLHTPLDAGHLALVLFDFARWAILARPENICELPLPKVDDLIEILKALQLIAEVQEGSVPSISDSQGTTVSCPLRISSIVRTVVEASSYEPSNMEDASALENARVGRKSHLNEDYVSDEPVEYTAMAEGVKNCAQNVDYWHERDLEEEFKPGDS
jgi:hypothetical protein